MAEPLRTSDTPGKPTDGVPTVGVYQKPEQAGRRTIVVVVAAVILLLVLFLLWRWMF